MEVRRVICLSYLDTLRESMSTRAEIMESQSMANYIIRYQFPFFEMPDNSQLSQDVKVREAILDCLIY